MMLLKKNALSFLFAIFWGLNAFCNISHIENNPNYYCYTGKGMTVSDADKDALAGLSRQILTIVYGKTAETSNDEIEESVKTFTISCLQNVERIILDDEPKAVVFRYVLKTDVEKMVEERTNKIKDLVASGQSAERQLLIDDALRYYYWALMLSKAMPKSIFVEFDGEKEQKNCLTYLPSKIKSVLSNLNATFVSSHTDGNRIFTTLDIKYNQHAVSSVQLYYFDGQSYVGPLSVRDGFAQLELQKAPNDKRLSIRYEYAFQDEAESLDDELKAVFDAFKPEITNSTIAIPIKINDKDQTIIADKKAKNGISIEVNKSEKEQIAAIPTANISSNERINLSTPGVTEGYAQVMMDIENAISANDIESVYKHFEPSAYALLDTLMTRTGKVRLAKKSQNFEFIEDGNQVIARFCKITIRYKSGKTFTENLSFRFNKISGKIESLAFALTKKAEDDIFNARAEWPEISRFAIMQFMEDYQTAFALKRIGYLSQIFSNDAVIVSGVMLKKATPTDLEGRTTITTPYATYKKENKSQYLNRISGHFKSREYIHLKFGDNNSTAILSPKFEPGYLFAIEISQNYQSSRYNDKGYLTLFVDAIKRPMIIHTRLWQPGKNNIDLKTFADSITF